jgi:hypothetical protein
MKKVIPGVIVLAAVAVAVALVFFKRASSHHVPALELAPAESIFFLHFPDLKRTAMRWPQTGVAKIGAEPEMQAFLAKAKENGQLKLWTEKIWKLASVDPGEAFVAVTSIDGPSPKFIAGISFAGRKSALEEALTEPRAEFKKAWPAGKSDVVLQGKTEIETFTYDDKTVGEAIQNGWYLVSNDMELLRKTLSAPAEGLGAQALGADVLYKKATSHLPVDGEAVMYAKLSVLTERLVSLLVASGQTPDPKQLEELKKMQALAWGTKFEGAQMRDTLFLLSPGSSKEAPLARNSLALSGPGTFLTYASPLPATFEMPEASMALGMLVPGFAAMQKGLEDKGLKWGDFGKGFGPEFGVVANWMENAQQPSMLLALDVRDAATARGFVEVFTGDLPGSPAWGRKEENGVTIFQSPATGGLVSLTPTAALTDKFLVIGLSAPEIIAALEQLKSGQMAIANTPAYGVAVKAVGAPTSGFAYLDLKALFERSYGTLRPFLAMSLMFSPEAGQYLDAGKLPNAETIGKHLTPSVYSQSVTEEGTLVESVGTLTFNQVMIGVVGGAVAAAFPMIESSLAGGLKIDPNTLQITPPAPVAPPGVVAPEKAAGEEGVPKSGSALERVPPVLPPPAPVQ